MAKDGTARGGARAGSGRKSKALKEKLDSGNPGGRKLTVMELPADSDLSGEDMPEPKNYMLDRQKNGGDLDAEDVFRETWLWLKERGCEKLVSTQLVRNYAMSVSRWIQCEHAISEYGFLAKHPTTGQAIASPYVSMSQNYMKQVNNLWYQIFQLLRKTALQIFPGQHRKTMLWRDCYALGEETNMNFRLNRFMKKLKNCRPYLTKQQYRTIKGQALSGDVDGAQKGLNSLLRRCVYEHNNRNAACSR